jgi:hypothetical protein
MTVYTAQHYFVICPECKGHRYLEGRVLCYKCGGEGRISIPEFRNRPVPKWLSFSARFVVYCVLAIVIILIAAALPR